MPYNTLEKERAWRYKNRERVNAYMRAWRAAHPVRNQYRDSYLRRRYGLALKQYTLMLETQGGVCKICGNPPKKNRLHVDHAPDGRVRGLLCTVCNTVLVTRDAATFARVLAYLQDSFDGRLL